MKTKVFVLSLVFLGVDARAKDTRAPVLRNEGNFLGRVKTQNPK
jgi:hypothetical protein